MSTRTIVLELDHGTIEVFANPDGSFSFAHHPSRGVVGAARLPAAAARVLEDFLAKSDRSLLTPVLHGTDYRLHLRVRWLEGEVRRSPGVFGVVVDEETGRHYRIEGKPCSLTNPDGSGCYCDAWAFPLEGAA